MDFIMDPVKLNKQRIDIMIIMQRLALKSHIKELYILKEIGFEKPTSSVHLNKLDKTFYNTIKKGVYIRRRTCINCSSVINLASFSMKAIYNPFYLYSYNNIEFSWTYIIDQGSSGHHYGCVECSRLQLI
jgi:hypothetical protein